MGDDDDLAGRAGKMRMLQTPESSPVLELELDVKTKDEVRASMKPAPVGSMRPDARGVGAALGVDRGLLSRPPPPIDNIEAKLLGNFGSVPAAIWELPGYARRVKSRLAELEAAIATRDGRATKAKKELEDAAVSLARRGITTCNALSRQARAPYVATLEQIAKREAHLRDVDQALAAQMKEHQQKVEALEKRVESQLSEVLAARRELRTAGGEDPNAKATPAISAARKKVQDEESKLQILRDERTSLEQSAKALRGASTPAVDAARADYASICADLAQFIVDDRMNFGEEFDDARVRIARLRETSAAAQKELSLYRAAAGSYDSAAAAKGRNVMYGAIGAVVLFVILVGAIVALK
jgi:chromosome segregation ATPase